MHTNTIGYIALGAAAVLLIAGLLSRYSYGPGAPAPTEQEAADSALGQYAERPISPAPSPAAAPAAPLTEGCALHFSFVPAAKIAPPGSAISYTFTIRNEGKDPCENASFSAYWSDDETFASASPPPTASTYYWSIGALPSRAMRTIHASTRASETVPEGQISNEACATADNSSDVCAQNIVFVGASAPAGATSPAPLPSSGASVASALRGAHEAGIWVWDSPLQMAAGYPARMLAAASGNGFNTVYITVDDYLEISSLPAGAAKDAKSAAYMNALAAVISAARQKGIQADIEGGARDWAYPENRWKGYALIDFLAAYNAAHPEARARGLQYDVEPYLLPEYQDHKEAVLGQFLEFVDESASRMKNVDGRFSVVIPHFYDSRQAWTPSFAYKGKTAFAYTHLLNILEAKPGSALIIMAYRNFSQGENGSEDLAQAELDEAAAGSYATTLVVAQETGNVDPPYVTFYGMSKADLAAKITDIKSTFGSNPNFGGVAVHYLEPFLDLK